MKLTLEPIKHHDKTETSFLTEFPKGNRQYTFTVKAVDTSGNRSESSEEIKVWNGMNGARPGDNVAVLVYPNPSEGQFNVRVSSDEAGPVEIYVYDNQGNVITGSSETMTSMVYEKEFSLYPAEKGVDVVRVFFNDSVIVKSLLLE